MTDVGESERRPTTKQPSGASQAITWADKPHHAVLGPRQWLGDAAARQGWGAASLLAAWPAAG